MLIAFRVDATPTTGNGHLARCLTLADALAAADARCLFLCRDLPQAAVTQLAERGHAVTLLESREIGWGASGRSSGCKTSSRGQSGTRGRRKSASGGSST